MYAYLLTRIPWRFIIRSLTSTTVVPLNTIHIHELTVIFGEEIFFLGQTTKREDELVETHIMLKLPVPVPPLPFLFGLSYFSGI